MPYGSTNGGGPGLPGGGQGIGARIGTDRSDNRTPISSVSKSITYAAAGGNSTQVLAINKSAGIAAVTTDDPSAVFIENTGMIPVVAMIGYESYTALAHGAVHYLHTLLHPGEVIQAPVRGIIPLADQLHLTDETVLDFTAPHTNLYTDSGADVDHATASDMGSDTTHTTLNLEDGHSKFLKVGDLIRLENEICEVTAVGTGADLANSTATIVRGLYGSTAATHADDVAVRFPFFNEYYDYDRVLSGNTQLVQTDARGRFKCSNFFGYGRLSTGLPQGITPGSFCMKFYSNAYMDIPMGGTGVSGGTGDSNIPITPSTSSMLSTSTEYSFNLILDDSIAVTVSFTTDSSDVSFSSVIRKIQDAINTATQTASNGLYGYSCTVSIVNGRLRITSNSHLIPHDGTNGSKVLIADGAGGTNVLTGSAGIFPDDAVMNAPVAPELPDLSKYDPITYAKTMNMERVMYDDGVGNLIFAGKVVGNINYETGGHSFTIPSLPNANWEVSVIHNSPFSGKLDSGKVDANALTAIHANVLNKNRTGELEVKVY